MTHTVRIQQLSMITHDVRKIVVSKPEGYAFEPGQATDVAINKPGWQDEKRPFTFTCLPSADTLEFSVKIYPDHDGVTEQIGKLEEGDELLIGDPWGSIAYKGPGTFIAGGAGITPFIAILRQLRADNQLDGNRLLFGNKLEKDIILREEFEGMRDLDVEFALSAEERPGLLHGRFNEISLRHLIDDVTQNFYVCGPPAMVEDVNESLEKMGAETTNLVFEE